MLSRQTMGKCCAPVVAALWLGSWPRVADADLWTRGGGTNLWSNNLNWQDGSQPGIGDSAIFPTPIPAGAFNITVPNGAQAASVLFNDSYTLSGGTGNLALGPAGIITIQPGKTGTLSVPLTANANVLTINGAGTLIMNNASSRTANTNISNAVVHLNNAASLGTGPVNVSSAGTGGTFELNGGLNFVGNVNLQPNGSLRASGGLGVFGGTVNVSQSTTVNLIGGTLATDTLRFGNVAPNTYTNGTNTTTIVHGPGTVYFLNSNDYAGNWQINSGKLKFLHNNGLGTGTTPIVVNNTGTLELQGASFQNRTITLNSGGTLGFDSGGFVYETVTVASNAAANISLLNGSTGYLGLNAAAINGGGGTSSISVSTNSPGSELNFTLGGAPGNYAGSWNIGLGVIVTIDENGDFGNVANPVSMTNATLRTTQSMTTGRTFSFTGGTIETAFGSSLTMSAGIGSGSGVTTKTGDGTLILGANSARTGTMDIASGLVVAKSSSALGTMAVNLTLGQPTLQIDNVTIGNNLAVQNNNTTLLGTGVAGATGPLSITAGATAAISTSLSTDTFSLTGVISGSSSQVNVSGPGTVIFGGSTANSYTGLTSVNGGTLRLAKTSGNAIASNVSIGDGTGTDVLINSASEQIANANVNLFGPGAQWQLSGFTETIATVTMSAGAIHGGGSGTIILNGGIATGITTISSTVPAEVNANINLNNQLRGFNIQNGTANPDLIINGVISNGAIGKSNSGTLLLTGAGANTFTGLSQLNAGTLALAKNDPGITALAGDISLGFQGAATLRFDQSEQMANSASLIIGSGGTVNLQTNTETISNVTMNAGQIIGTGTLILGGNFTSNTATATASISTTLDLSATAHTFSVADGAVANDATFSGAVRNGTLNKTGAGTLALSGGGPAAHQNLTINLNAGGLLINETQRLSALNIATGLSANMGAHGNRVLYTDALSIAPTARLDLANNDLVVSSISFTQVQAWVNSGFGSPTNPGITSATSTGAEILALFDNAQVGASEWLGVSISANAIVGKYTYFGDVNLDGQVSGDDYTVVDANLNTDPAVGIEWLSGDANLDGLVTGDDYTVIDANLGLGAGNPLTPANLAVVPEPLFAGLVAGAGAVMLRGGRHRRRRASAEDP